MHPYSQNLFQIGQKVVIFNPKKEVLLLRRSLQTSRPGGWDFPGGALEHEELYLGLCREVLEETGLEISKVRLLQVVLLPKAHEMHQTLLIGYAASCIQTEVRLGLEHSSYEWMTLDKALQLNLPSPHRAFLEEAMEMRA